MSETHETLGIGGKVNTVKRENESSLPHTSFEGRIREANNNEARGRQRSHSDQPLAQNSKASVQHPEISSLLRIIECPSCHSQYTIPSDAALTSLPHSHSTKEQEASDPGELSLHCSSCDAIFLFKTNPFFERDGEFISDAQALEPFENNTRGGSENVEDFSSQQRKHKSHTGFEHDNVLENSDFSMEEIEEDAFEQDFFGEPIQEPLFSLEEEGSNPTERSADPRSNIETRTETPSFEEPEWEDPPTQNAILEEDDEWAANEWEWESPQQEERAATEFGEEESANASAELTASEIPEWDAREEVTAPERETLLDLPDDIFEDTSSSDLELPSEERTQDFDAFSTRRPGGMGLNQMFDNIENPNPRQNPLSQLQDRNLLNANTRPTSVISITSPEENAENAEEHQRAEVRYTRAERQLNSLSSNTGTALFTLLIVGILVGLGGFAVFLEKDGAYQGHVKEFISQDLPLPASSKIALDGVVLREHSLRSGGRIYSIDGQLENGEDFLINQVDGEAALYDAQGVLLMKRRLPFGALVPAEQGFENAQDAFSREADLSHQNTRIKPKERRKVRILFNAEDVAKAHFFTMRPLAVYR